nr:ABC transporter substrate-binding protein [uncultured Butyrivibrio sp.]
MYLNKKSYKFILLFLTMLVCLWGCGRIPDGEYAASVTLTGGSGKAYIESPCKIEVKNGQMTADIVFSSPNYDYMIVSGKTYSPVNEEGNSEFIIPVVLDKEMQVQADTTAMSSPHLIDYTLTFSLVEDDAAIEDSQEDNDLKTNASEKDRLESLNAPVLEGYSLLSSDENDYAQGFRIHRYEKDIAMITVDDGRKYLILPEGVECPDKLPSDTTVIKRPLSDIYLAATGAMCHFDSLGATYLVSLSSIQEKDWYIASAKDAMENGSLIYGGKYNAPDYEMILEKKIQLAIENTMILHAPKVLERLEDLEIPVFIDRSSYENEPLGRLEWIRVYGLLADKEKEAGEFFDQQKSLVESLDKSGTSGKKVAVFSVNSNHQIVTRKGNDYLSKMIEQAGGEYLSPVENQEDMASTQMTISAEAFLAYAKEADILIYNGTIQNAPTTIDELTSVDKLFSQFDAVREGNVWYTDKALYQFAGKTGTIIENLNQVIMSQEKETEFFHGLN